MSIEQQAQQEPGKGEAEKEITTDGPLLKVNMPWDREAEEKVNSLLEGCGNRLLVLKDRPGDVTYEESVLEWDSMVSVLDEITSRGSWDFNTHPDVKVRDRCEKTTELMSKLWAHLFTLDLPYSVLQEVNQRLGDSLRWDRAAYLKDLLIAFEQNGVHLDRRKKDRVLEIDDDLAEIGTRFSKTLKDTDIFLDVTPEEAKDIPPHSLVQSEDGKTQFLLRQDSFKDLLQSHPDAAIRERVYREFFSGTGDLAPLLDKMRKLRDERSRLVANKSYVELEASNEGFATSEVHQTLDELLEWTEKRFQETMADYRELNGGEAPKCYDLSYLEEHAPTEGLDPQILKEYLCAERTVQVLLELSGELYGLRFEATEHDEKLRIERYRVLDSDGKELGLLHLDLYPRQGKYSHAACWTIRGRASHYPDRTAEMGLVCNFKEKDLPGGKTGLLWDDVVTAFHEYGHVLHGLLIDAEPSGSHWVPRSLVEVPSQVFENWALDPMVLDRLARHYETGAHLDDKLRKLLYKTEQRFAARHVRTQVLYARFDLDFHDRVDTDPTEIWDGLAASIFGDGFYPKGLPWFTRFGHLDGYGAKYWGYKFADIGKSQIYWSIVHRSSGHLLDREIGQRLYDELLRFGGLKKLNQVTQDFSGTELRGLPYVLETLLDYPSLRLHLESHRDKPYDAALEAVFQDVS